MSERSTPGFFFLVFVLFCFVFLPKVTEYRYDANRIAKLDKLQINLEAKLFINCIQDMHSNRALFKLHHLKL